MARRPVAAFEPEEVWCAAGSGVLARGLAAAWPKARRHVVQIGRDLTPREVGGATIHVHPRKFSDRAALGAPFSWLNRSVALYRLAFGQPRQDDLLALLDQVRDEIAPEALAQLQISLRPD